MDGARRILASLEAAGCEAYIVGGAVRDRLLDRACSDIDIATSAQAEVILAVAKRCGWQTVEVGRAYGCIVVVVGDKPYEVTTFRSERYGADSHRPSEVICGASLADDVRRRDFTVNGMVMTADGRVIDLVGGQDDLAAGVIRCIGDGRQRFAEDALRSFRACRFAAQLGFTLCDDIIPAIRANLDRVGGLSVERVRAEVEKTLLAPYSARGLDAMMASGLFGASMTVHIGGEAGSVSILPELVHLAGLRQNPLYHAHDTWGHTLAVVEALPKVLVLRWAGLLHDVAKGLDGIRGEKNGQPTDHGHADRGAEMARDILRRFGYSRAFVERVTWLVREHMGCAPSGQKGTLRWLKKRVGDFKCKDDMLDALDQLGELLRADGIGTGRDGAQGRDALFADVVRMAKDTALYVSELAVSGRDLLPIVGEGRAVGEMMRRLLARVTEGELANERDVLCRAAEKSEQRRRSKMREQEEAT